MQYTYAEDKMRRWEIYWEWQELLNMGAEARDNSINKCKMMKKSVQNYRGTFVIFATAKAPTHIHLPRIQAPYTSMMHVQCRLPNFVMRQQRRQRWVAKLVKLNLKTKLFCVIVVDVYGFPTWCCNGISLLAHILSNTACTPSGSKLFVITTCRMTTSSAAHILTALSSFPLLFARKTRETWQRSRYILKMNICVRA